MFEEFSLGAKKDKRDKRDYRIAGVIKGIELPEKFSLSELFRSKNQFSRPSCTSQAQGHHKERQEKARVSSPFIMALTKELEGNKEDGAYTRNSFKVIHGRGVCLDTSYPEPDSKMSWEEYINVDRIPRGCFVEAKEHKSGSYWRINKSIGELKEALFTTKNSIVASMAWYSEFNNNGLGENGELPTKFKNFVGGHAVEIVGWNNEEEYILFKNSWGYEWGNGGFFRMPYSIFDKVVWDIWTSLDLPEELPVDNYYERNRTWKTYMRERSIAFNPWLIKKIKRLPNNREIKALAYGHWDFESVFKGKNGDIWLKLTKMEAKKRNLI